MSTKHCAAFLVGVSIAGTAAAQAPFYGEIVTWGAGGGLTGAPAGPFVRIAAGPTHALAMRADGTVAGWGQNQHGQATAPPGQFIDISAGGTGSDGRSFGLRPGGIPEMWGLTTGFPPAPPGTFTKIRAKYDYAILIHTDGTLVYWGPPSPLSAVPAGTFTDVAPGLTHAAAIRSEGTLVAWGDNTFGQLNVPAGSGFIAVTSGAAHSLAVAVTTGHALFAWGRNNAGQTQVPSIVLYPMVAARDDWSLAHTSGSIGLGAWGQAPAQAEPPGRYRAIASGETFGLALVGCRSDCNSTGTLSVSDFGCYRTVFVQGVPYADSNGDGQLTASDWGAFQTRWVMDVGQNCEP